MLLDKISTITEIEELWETVEWLNAQLEAKQPMHQNPQMKYILSKEMLYGPVREETIEILKRKGFIPAIKNAREILHIGLKEAKDAVDEVRSATGYGNSYWCIKTQTWIYDGVTYSDWNSVLEKMRY